MQKGGNRIIFINSNYESIHNFHSSLFYSIFLCLQLVQFCTKKPCQRKLLCQWNYSVQSADRRS
ncbi:unnamed protein product, partial [Vitis vinifera]